MIATAVLLLLVLIGLSIPVAADADGILTIAALKADRVDVILRETPAGSREYVIAKKGSGETGIKTRIGNEAVNLSLELNSPTTVMNARAGEALMAAMTSSMPPMSNFGIRRPCPAPWRCRAAS